MLRLLAAALSNWPLIDGRCALQGVDPADLPLDRLLNLTYYLLTDGREADDVAKLDAQLNALPAGERRKTAPELWSAEAETAALTAFGAQAGVL